MLFCLEGVFRDMECTLLFVSCLSELISTTVPHLEWKFASRFRFLTGWNLTMKYCLFGQKGVLQGDR